VEEAMGKKILIVDDSRTIRQQVSFTLAKSGFVVVEAEDGKDGIAKLGQNEDIAMIISDVNMPNMNGLEMVEAIKADLKHKTLPIVMLTTEGSGELIERAKAAGARGWIVKPFKPDQLIAAVNKLTGAA
jgi:two-component system chemotaxis response regulator CheY